MRLQFQDMQDYDNPYNGTSIDTEQKLVGVLDEMRQREPFGLELVGEHNHTLTILLGKTTGAVQYAPSNGDPPYFLAVVPGSRPIANSNGISPHNLAFRADREDGLQSPEFLVGGTATPMPTRYCLPFDLVKNAAVHFLQEGGRAPSLTWEEV